MNNREERVVMGVSLERLVIAGNVQAKVHRCIKGTIHSAVQRPIEKFNHVKSIRIAIDERYK